MSKIRRSIYCKVTTDRAKYHPIIGRYIQVIQCSHSDYHYKDKIGNVYQLYDETNDLYIGIVERNNPKYGKQIGYYFRK